MQIKIFFVPSTKAIIAKRNNQFVSLPFLKEINKPDKIIPCVPFLKESKTSKWHDVPDDSDSFYDTLSKYESDGKLKIHKLELSIRYTRNEVNERLFKLSGNVPQYVLEGIAYLLTELS